MPPFYIAAYCGVFVFIVLPPPFNTGVDFLFILFPPLFIIGGYFLFILFPPLFIINDELIFVLLMPRLLGSVLILLPPQLSRSVSLHPVDSDVL